jgi:hypothetical protein
MGNDSGMDLKLDKMNGVDILMMSFFNFATFNDRIIFPVSGGPMLLCLVTK